MRWKTNDLQKPVQTAWAAIPLRPTLCHGAPLLSASRTLSLKGNYLAQGGPKSTNRKSAQPRGKIRKSVHFLLPLERSVLYR